MKRSSTYTLVKSRCVARCSAHAYCKAALRDVTAVLVLYLQSFRKVITASSCSTVLACQDLQAGLRTHVSSSGEQLSAESFPASSYNDRIVKEQMHTLRNSLSQPRSFEKTQQLCYNQQLEGTPRHIQRFAMHAFVRGLIKRNTVGHLSLSRIIFVYRTGIETYVDPLGQILELQDRQVFARSWICWLKDVRLQWFALGSRNERVQTDQYGQCSDCATTAHRCSASRRRAAPTM
jgi:hypothetical protein